MGYGISILGQNSSYQIDSDILKLYICLLLALVKLQVLTTLEPRYQPHQEI